ncbi:hypothetical protein Tco_0799539 [Tanacetum coccineum]|uniref:Uncharacterized protein n=1 Tax=Tanacetum coccineum TaxID=301880 RepID=A0ABQ4ZTF9_9ASTR
MNQNFNYSNSFGLDQIQPPQFSTVQLLEIERINKEESFKKKDMSIEEIMSEKRLIDDEIKDILNDLSYKRFRGEKIDDEYERDCEIKIKQLLQDYNGLDIEMRKKERVLMEEKYIAASQRVKSICNYDDDEDDSIPLRDIIAQYFPSVAITSSPPVLPTREPKDSLIMGNEELSTIPEKESDEFIKSSVEDLILILREFEDTSGSDSENVLPSSDDFSPIFEEKSVTLSNPLFDSNNFTSSDNELLSDEGISEDVKIYSNPLFEFDDEYIFNDVNPFFDEVLENIKSKDSYVSNLDEPTFLVTPLFDAYKDECFDQRGVIDEIDAFLDMDISTDIENGYHDLEGDIIYLESLLIEDTSPNLPPKVFLDHDPRSLKDEPDNDDLMTEDKVFDPGIHEKSFSPTFVKLTFEDRHYFPITFFIRIFLAYLTYSVDSSFLLSSGREDTIFDPGISTFHFSSLKPVAYENPIVIFLFFCFCPKDNGIRGESS